MGRGEAGGREPRVPRLLFVLLPISHCLQLSCELCCSSVEEEEEGTESGRGGSTGRKCRRGGRTEARVPGQFCA